MLRCVSILLQYRTVVSETVSIRMICSRWYLDDVLCSEFHPLRKFISANDKEKLVYATSSLPVNRIEYHSKYIAFSSRTPIANLHCTMFFVALQYPQRRCIYHHIHVTSLRISHHPQREGTQPGPSCAPKYLGFSKSRHNQG